LISAIATSDEIVRGNFFDDEKDDIPNKKVNTRLKPFLLSKESDEKIEFEIVFYNEYLFQYGFSIQKGVVLNEWLEVDEALVFNKEKTKLKYGPMYEDQLREFSKYREDRLYIGVLYCFISEDPLKKIIKSFRSFFINQLNLYSELIIESTIKGLNIGLRYSNRLIENDEFRKKVVTYVQKVDLGIDDIIIEEEMIKTSDTNEMKKKPVLKTVHNIYMMKKIRSLIRRSLN
jgi:hypothetical protein